MKKNRIKISAVLIFVILSSMGLFSLFRTFRSYYYNSVFSDGFDFGVVCRLTNTFADDYEKKVPHGAFYNSLLFMLSGVCSSNQVIIGDNDWLFYSSKVDGDPIADYEGTNEFSIEELKAASENMLSIQEYLQNKGIGFCLIIPPNKENVYHNYMPKKYIHSEKSRTDALLNYLQHNGINAVNPKTELLSSSKDNKTYYKYDTHWNELGAYIGTKCVLDRFSIQTPEISEDLVETDTKANADLISIAGLQGVFSLDYGLTTNRSVHDLEAISSIDERELEHIYNKNAKNDKTVFVIGDSFREAIAPNLAYVFKNVYVVHRSKYKKEMIDEISPDYVILEFVERYSNEVKNFKLY